MPQTRRFSVLAVVLLAVAGGAVDVFAQDAPVQSAGPETADVERAPVIVDGEVLFSVRGVTAFPAERRAEAIADEIRALARDPAIQASSLTLVDAGAATWILANGRRVFRVHDEDAVLESIDRHTLAETHRLRIVEAIATYRDARQPARLWRGGFSALVATLLLLVAAYAGRRVVSGLQARWERRYAERIRDVAVHKLKVVSAEQVWRTLSSLISFAWGSAVILMLVFYLRYVLSLFPWTRTAGNRMVTLVIDPVRSLGLGFINTFPNLLFLAILFLLTRAAVKLLRLFFENVATGSVRLRNFEPEWAEPTYKLVRLLLIAFAVVVAYPYVPGSQTDAFKGISLFVGIVFSLGSTSLIGNIISGVGMTYRRTFRTGDIVKIGGHLGEVKAMRLLVTHLRTPKNEEVIVPNASIVSDLVVNYSSMAKDRGLILHTTVDIGYDTPWRQVEAMLVEAATRTAGLLRDPPPFVHQIGLGVFAVTYEINVFCDAPLRMRELYAALHRNVLDVFNESGVQIMTPAYEGDPDEPKVVPKDKWFGTPAADALRTPPAPRSVQK